MGFPYQTTSEELLAGKQISPPSVVGQEAIRVRIRRLQCYLEEAAVRAPATNPNTRRPDAPSWRVGFCLGWGPSGKYRLLEGPKTRQAKELVSRLFSGVDVCEIGGVSCSPSDG